MNDPAFQSAPVRIAYITTLFPGVTETAVIKEIYEVDQAGFAVDVFAVRGKYDGVFDHKALRFRDRVFYWTPARLARGLAEHTRRLVRGDRVYRDILKTVALESGSARATVKNSAAVLFALSILPDVRRRNIRYLHANFGSYQATSAWALGRLTGIPYGFTVHAHELFVAASLLRAKVEGAAQVISISDYNVRFMEQRLGLPVDKVRVVRCGVDLAEYDPATRRPAGAARVLGVGRLDEMKGFEYLIDATGILKDQGVAVEIDIIGPDPGGRREFLAQRARSRGVADRVHLRGTVTQEELWEAYRHCDLFVLPCVTAGDGSQDGIPATLMEAMAMAVPSISTQTSGIPELVTDGETGCCVPPRDAAALAGAIRELLDSPALAQRMGEAGRRRVLAEYDYARNARRLADFIRACILRD